MSVGLPGHGPLHTAFFSCSCIDVYVHIMYMYVCMYVGAQGGIKYKCFAVWLLFFDSKEYTVVECVDAWCPQ